MASPTSQPTDEGPDVTRIDPVFEIVENTSAEVAPLSTDVVPGSTGLGDVVPTAAGDPGGGAFAASAGAVDTIVNAGKFAWDVMKDSKPVANVASDNANAIPAGANWVDLIGWAPNPSRISFRYHTENPEGTNATDINVTLQWYFNGQYQGAGQYINAATVIAAGDVAFGNTVNITASINNPMNLGTRDKPVAALPVKITIQESNWVQNLTSAYTGQLKGNGDSLLYELS